MNYGSGRRGERTGKLAFRVLLGTMLLLGWETSGRGESAPGIVELTDPSGAFREAAFQQPASPEIIPDPAIIPPATMHEFPAQVFDPEAQDDLEEEAAELPLQKLHDILEEKGATTAVVQYTGQYYINAHGGISTNNGRFRGNLDVWLYTDTEKSGLWENGTIGMYFQATHGRTLTRTEVGDYMFYSLLETLPRKNDVTQLGELWYEHTFLDEALSIRAGKLDGYLYLAFQEMSEGFLNTAFTLIPPTPLPSWPFQVLGVYSKYVAESGVEVRIASYESKDVGPQYFLPYVGDSGVITFGEFVVPWEALGDDTGGSSRFGIWYDTQDFYSLAPGPTQVLEGNYGFYAGTQRMLYEESNCEWEKCDQHQAGDEEEAGCGEEEEAEPPPQGLYAFFQYGWAPSDRNPLYQFFGGGIAYRGLLPRRDQDLIGLGYANGMFGVESELLNGSTKEVVIETFYRWQTRRSLMVQPNLQYIANSGGNGRDSFPVGLQFIQKF